MSNPIKAIIILKEDSGGGGGGAGCGMFLIIAHMIVGGIFLDWGTLQVLGGGFLIFLAYLWFEEGGTIIAALIIFGGMWGCGKLLEEDKDSNGAKSERISSIEKTTQGEHSNSEVYSEDKPKSIDIQNETKSEKKIPYEVFTENKSKKIDIPNRVKSEPNKSPAKNLIELSSIDYPASFLTISASQFLAADGKETVIPAGTRILILKRTPAGMLTLEANGKTYLGYESRLSGNIKK